MFELLELNVDWRNRVRFLAGAGIFLFSTTSVLAMGCSKHPV